MDSQPTPDALYERMKALTRMSEISLILNSTLELDPLLEFIMESAAELVNSEAASILLMDRHTHDLYFTSTSSRSAPDLLGKPVPLEGSIAGLILREDRPVAIDDVSDDPRHYRQMDQATQFTTRSILGVPMRSKENVIGVLEAVNKIDGSWTDVDQFRLSILAAQAAVAIENARLLQELQEAYDDLAQLDKMKNDFIAIASHELRTPLGVILGYATFLKDESEGEAGEHANVVLRSALQLRTLIEDMVNLRYLQTGESELDRENMKLSTLLLAAQEEIRTLAEARGHTLTVDAPDGAVIVHVDAHLMSMALGNILNNAVKFTPHGGQITVRTVRKPREVWVEVADNGVGIPEEHLERIFEEFHQVEDHMTRRHGGMGLGLSIAKALAEAHGGRIWAESPGEGQGSTFTLALPVVDSAADTPAADDPAADDPAADTPAAAV